MKYKKEVRARRKESLEGEGVKYHKRDVGIKVFRKMSKGCKEKWKEREDERMRAIRRWKKRKEIKKEGKC